MMMMMLLLLLLMMMMMMMRWGYLSQANGVCLPLQVSNEPLGLDARDGRRSRFDSRHTCESTKPKPSPVASLRSTWKRSNSAKTQFAQGNDTPADAESSCEHPPCNDCTA
jgi:hypothetical protein